MSDNDTWPNYFALAAIITKEFKNDTEMRIAARRATTLLRNSHESIANGQNYRIIGLDPYKGGRVAQQPNQSEL